MATDEPPGVVEALLDTPNLAHALESDRFKQFLDQLPVATAVSMLGPPEKVVYANHEFERLTGQNQAEIVGESWSRLPGETVDAATTRTLNEALYDEGDYLGTFIIPRGDSTITVDAWSSVIEDDDGAPVFRLVALVETTPRPPSMLDQLESQLREKDIQLKELQHRVKNNLQMITALIRVEARGISDRTLGEGFDRLAGRVEALGLLYRSLGTGDPLETIDLGVYLSGIASAVMRAHAIEGIRLDLLVDTWDVSIDVAMPTGLVVNELLTNALKHAFTGRQGGTILLHSKVTETGCRVVVADDGVGLPEGATWPKQGKLSSLIVQSLVQNAKATLDVDSAPGKGMRVTIEFRREDALPTA
jgi:two-component sensor histidine kinase